jgi:hypothetical protein
MHARGIVTEIGGATSHAAVTVARSRLAVVGRGTGVAEALSGKLITIDGTEGEVLKVFLELTAWSESDTPDLRELADLARKMSPLRAHATGDYPALESNSDAAVRDALAAGHTDVVSPTPLITMLTALRLTSDGDVVGDNGWTYPMSELKVLQAIRLKGRVTPADVAATLDEDPRRVAATIAGLTAAGLPIQAEMFRISPDGRERLNTLLAEERSGIDTAAITAAYHDFRAVNTAFKALVSDWRLKMASPTPRRRRLRRRSAGSAQRNPLLVVPIIAAAALRCRG